MDMRRRQCGLTVLGFLFVATVLIVVALVGFRVTPAYIEYYSVQKALQDALGELRDPMAIGELRKGFQRRVDSGYIESVRSSDIDVTKDRNQVTASIVWSRKLHLVGNASLLLDFEASATR
jgi:hypothetical protein